MRRTFMKPEDPDAAPGKKVPARSSRSTSSRHGQDCDDKERAIGLVAAPLAAAIGFLVVHTLVANDPAQHLKSGALNKHYVNPSTYDDLFVVLLVLSLLMLTMALLRKRLFLGIATALYGLRSSTFTTGVSASRSSSAAPGTWCVRTGCSGTLNSRRARAGPAVTARRRTSRRRFLQPPSRTSGTRRGSSHPRVDRR